MKESAGPFECPADLFKISVVPEVTLKSYHSICQRIRNYWNMKIILLLIGISVFSNITVAQKVLQIEKFGKAKTKKIYLGETVFIRTVQNPDWFEGIIEDMRPDAQAIVFYDRIVPIRDITAIRFKRTSVANGIGKALQWSWVVPVTYQGIFDIVNPPSSEELRASWIATGSIAAGSFLLGTLMKLLPPKKYQFGEGKKRRLRVLDLTFYPENAVMEG